MAKDYEVEITMTFSTTMGDCKSQEDANASAIDMIKKGEVDFNNFNYEVADQSWRERDE
jgi:hypothetical protein